MKRRKKRRGTPGSRPGEIQVDPTTLESTVSVTCYDGRRLTEKRNVSLVEVEEMVREAKESEVVWVHLEGLGRKEILEETARLFKIHPLAIEDVTHVPQRPKVERYSEQLFLIVQLLSRHDEVQSEQMSLCLGSGFVVTFLERVRDPLVGGDPRTGDPRTGDPFLPVRQRLRIGGRIRESGADYLAYALVDSAIDHYFPVLEQLREHLEGLEEALREPHPGAVESIRRARTELSEVRRAIGPMRDVTRSLQSSDWPQIAESTRLYLRDCRDHVLEAIEIVEGCREITVGLMDIHLSTVSHQANRTMKLLTVIATIFMPLSFLAGLYGMNFDTRASPWNMPELSSPFGYPVLLGVMLAVGFGLAAVFWKKGWFD